MPQLAVVPCFFCWDLGAVPEACSPPTLQVEKRDFVKVTLEAEAVSTPCWLSPPPPPYIEIPGGSHGIQAQVL